MPDITKGFSTMGAEEARALALELIVALKSLRELVDELKEAEQQYEPGLDEHPLQDAHKSYGFFTVAEQKFEAVLGPKE